MSKTGKKYTAAQKQVEAKPYTLDEAVPLVKKIKFAKFDETVELHMRLGVDPKHADQMVRGVVNLPNGSGRSLRVGVFGAEPWTNAMREEIEDARRAAARPDDSPPVPTSISLAPPSWQSWPRSTPPSVTPEPPVTSRS